MKTSEALTPSLLNRLSAIANHETLSATSVAVLRAAAKAGAHAHELTERATKLDDERNRLREDVDRLNMSVRELGKQSGDAAKPFVQRIVAAEDRIAQLNLDKQTNATDLDGVLTSVADILANLPP